MNNMFGNYLGGMLPGPQPQQVDPAENIPQIAIPEDSGGLRGMWDNFRQNLKSKPELLQAIAAMGASLSTGAPGAFQQGIMGAIDIMRQAELQRKKDTQQGFENQLSMRQMQNQEKATQATIDAGAASRAIQEKELSLQTQKFKWDMDWTTKKWAQELGLDTRKLALMERTAGSDEAVNAMRLQLLAEQVKGAKEANGRFVVDGTPAQMALMATANKIMDQEGIDKSAALVKATEAMPAILPKINKATGADKDNAMKYATQLFGQMAATPSMMAKSPEELWDTAVKLVNEGKVDLGVGTPPTPAAEATIPEEKKTKYPVGKSLSSGGKVGKITGHTANGVTFDVNGTSKEIPWGRLP